MTVLSDIPQLISDPKFQEFQSVGLIDPIALRNLFIKHDYRKLRDKNSVLEAVSILSEMYNLSESSINSILFRDRKLKHVPSKNGSDNLAIVPRT